MMGGSGMSHLDMGLGDLYLFGEVNLFNGTNVLPWIALSSQIKIPTANPNNYLGTGKFVYGLGLTFRKQIFSFIAFGDVGHLNFGDSEAITFLNPITFGIVLGEVLIMGNIHTHYTISVTQKYMKPTPLHINFQLEYIRV
ncbi:MAG: hypothetical protein E4H13_06550 [Calditrichales bacterium]|nr:MAG: hypothetical protein E4H13_06550 [Calditrichales bacterium]